MMRKHDIVIFKDNADLIVAGRKHTFRYGGFNGFRDGDMIKFHCIESDMMYVEHEINDMVFKVTGYTHVNVWTIDIYVEPCHVDSDVYL